MVQKRKIFDWIIFWLYLIPGTAFSAIASYEGFWKIYYHHSAYSLSPFLYTCLEIIFTILSVLGFVDLILFLRKKKWENIALLTTFSGILLFGRLLVTYLPHFHFFYVAPIVSGLVTIWCFFVAWYCHKRLIQRRNERKSESEHPSKDVLSD